MSRLTKISSIGLSFRKGFGILGSYGKFSLSQSDSSLSNFWINYYFASHLLVFRAKFQITTFAK